MNTLSAIALASLVACASSSTETKSKDAGADVAREAAAHHTLPPPEPVDTSSPCDPWSCSRLPRTEKLK